MTIPEEHFWTVEEWAEITREWQPVSFMFARSAKEKPYEERVAMGQQLYNKRNSMGDPAYVEFVSKMYQYPDDVLERIIESYQLNLQ